MTGEQLGGQVKGTGEQLGGGTGEQLGGQVNS